MAHQVRVGPGPRMTVEKGIFSAIGVQSGVALRKQYSSLFARGVRVVPVCEDIPGPETPVPDFRGAVENAAGTNHPSCAVHGQDLFQLCWR